MVDRSEYACSAVINGVVAVPRMLAMMLTVSGRKALSLSQSLSVLGWLEEALMAFTGGRLLWVEPLLNRSRIASKKSALAGFTVRACPLLETDVVPGNYTASISSRFPTRGTRP
jgi:hypothetical protein